MDSESLDPEFVALQNDPEYAAMVEELARCCTCTPSNRPCEGLMAGGLCDGINHDDDDEDFDGYDDDDY